MVDVGAPAEIRRNRILRVLPRAVQESLRGPLRRVTLSMGAILHQPGDPLTHVYFPVSGVISMLTVLGDGSAVEIATVGNEGMVDLAAFLGLVSSESRLLVQVPGEAFRMPIADFQLKLAESPILRTVLGTYIFELFTLVAQSSACNRKHSVSQQCARWILMTHDRVDGDEFPITHEFLAEILGVGRPTVTYALRPLKLAGAVDYHRGSMKVLDRRGLEAMSCECYGVIRGRFDRMPGATAGPGRLLSSGLRATKKAANAAKGSEARK
jgi:CRP-like cAMP-binding protein